MAYTPTEWQRGDKVTSEKLNKIENGIESAGGVLVATMDTATSTLDKTWQEIDNAAFTVVFYDASYGGTTSHLKLLVCGTAVEGTEYRVAAYAVEESTLVLFTTASADGYPVMQQGT